MTTSTSSELRDLHAARFAEIAALREMLAEAGADNNTARTAGLSGRMRESVAEILRLQKLLARLDA